MAAKQINWGYQFKRNYRGPLDPDSSFKTYDEMLASLLVFNGALVTVTDDPVKAKNGIYLVLGNDDTALYTFSKGAFGGNTNEGLPFLLSENTTVINVEYQSTDDTYKITLEDSIFKNLDIVGWSIASDLSLGEYAKVEYAIGDTIYLSPLSKRPLIGDTIFRVGNIIDKERQPFQTIYIKNDKAEYAVFLNDSLENVNKQKHTYIGQDNVGNPLLYSLNAYLKGLFIDIDGKDLALEIKSFGIELRTGLNDIRTELLATNRINNPFFLEKMKGWTTVNDALFFTTIQGKWVWTKNLSRELNGLYSAKRRGAYIDTFDERVCLSIQEGLVIQESKNLKKVVSDIEDEFPKLMTVSFMHYVVVGGTLQVKLGSTTITFDLQPSTEWTQFRTTMEWNGLDDLEFSFKNGTENYAEIKVRGIIFLESELETFKSKYQELFKYSDTLVQMAKEKLGEI